MLNFLNMHQGQYRIDDYFNKIFDSNLKTLDLTGGRQILRIKDTMDKAVDYPTDKEVKFGRIKV